MFRHLIPSIAVALFTAATLIIPMSVPVAEASTPELTVGVVMSYKLPQFEKAHKSFLAALEKEGYGPNNVTVYVQSPNPDKMSWENSIRKFVSVGVDVIVTYGAPATTTALASAGDIPVVFSFVYSPEVRNVDGSNATGVGFKVPVRTLLKTLKTLKDFNRLAVVYCPLDGDSKAQLAEVGAVSSELKFSIVEIAVKNTGDVSSSLKGISNKADSIFLCSSVNNEEASETIRIAKASGLPTATVVNEFAESGATLSLGPSAEEQGLMAARRVILILGGGSAKDTPVENSKQVDLVLNVQAVNSMGMKVPFELLNTATRVIK